MTEMPQTAREIRKQIIWGNRWITFNKKSLWFNKWITQNIVHVNDLFDEHGNFKEGIDMYKVKNAISKQRYPCRQPGKTPNRQGKL